LVLPVGTAPVELGVEPELPGVVPVADGVEPELPGVDVPVDPEDGVEPELPGVVPVADGVEPELPGVDVPVDPEDGVEPELPGVVPVADGVEPELPGVGAGVTTTAVAFTGVVATVTKVTTAAFFAAAGVDPDFPGAADEPPPELLFEFEAITVH
jgi:hypothetical protein